MRIFAISDLHIDYEQNKLWLFSLSEYDYKKDILIIAGDITDKLDLLAKSFKYLAGVFHKILYIPGNHELWVSRSNISSSLEKYEHICKCADDHGISRDVCHLNEISIVPLLGWYDFSFGEPGEKIKKAWNDFYACKWPEDFDLTDVTNYFVEQNIQSLNTKNKKIISFSHFLPTIDVMPTTIPSKFSYIYPVLGSNLLGEQLKILKPDLHIYGHSHVNRNITLDGINYINNAYGYPSEGHISRKELYLINEF